MRRSIFALAAGVLIATMLAVPDGASAQSKLKVATCARTITAGVGAPFAVAMKLGWLKQEGVDLELVQLPGSTDCVKTLATKDVDVSLPSVEALAIGRPQGIRAKVFYTAYQGNTYGLAVPDDSPIKRVEDLKGKTIGVTNMASAGVIIARAIAATHGLDPDKDISIVVAGEGAQPAAMLRGKQVDALSQFDTQYALIEIAGMKMRRIPSDIANFPANGFEALEDTIKNRRRDLIGFARAYAKGTIFAMNNAEATVRILYDVFPQTKPTGKDEATAIRDDVKVLLARAENFKLEKGGVKRWGESSEANYGAYADFMFKWGIIKEKITGKDLVTNELIDEINKFDPAKITAEAKAYKAK